MVGTTGAAVINVAWTLQYEMVFYLFFALLILGRWAFLLVMFVFLALVYSFSYLPYIKFLFSFMSNEFVLLFAMGMFASVASSSKMITTNRPYLYIVSGGLMYLLAAADTVLGINFLLGTKTIMYGVASSLLIFGLVKAERRGYVVGDYAWLQILGNSSYVLFLLHYPLISILCKISLVLHLDRFGMVGALVSYLTIFMLCLMSSVAFYYLIEKQINGYLRRKLISSGG